MSLPELTVEQVIELVKQLPPEAKKTVLATLNAELQPEAYTTDLKTQEWLAYELSQRRAVTPKAATDPETQEWLEVDLSGELPPYEWGEAGVPHGQPVKYTPGQGLVIEGGKKLVR